MATPVKVFREPRWPAFVAIFATALVHQSLPERLSVGSSWGLLSVAIVLLIPMILSYHRGHYNVSRILTFTATGVITLAMIASLALAGLGNSKASRSAPNTSALGRRALDHQRNSSSPSGTGSSMRAARLGRDKARGDFDSSFLFPQMIMRETSPKRYGRRNSSIIFFSPSTPALPFRPPIPPSSRAGPK